MKAWQAALAALVVTGCGEKDDPETSGFAPSTPALSVAQVLVTNSPAPIATNPLPRITNAMPARINITETRWLLCATNNANRPYTGTVIRNDAKGKKIAEGQFKDGLEHGPYEEWYASGKPKAKFRYERGQLMARQEWLETGKPVDLKLQGWNPDGTPYQPPARKIELTVGGGERNIERYRRYPVATLQIGFGPPDAVNGRVWIYHGLKIKHATTGQAFTTAKFTILDGRVLSVTVE